MNRKQAIYTPCIKENVTPNRKVREILKEKNTSVKFKIISG